MRQSQHSIKVLKREVVAFILASCLGVVLSGDVSNDPLHVELSPLTLAMDRKICFGYYQRSLVSPPKILRYFAQHEQENEDLVRRLVVSIWCSTRTAIYLFTCTRCPYLTPELPFRWKRCTEGNSSVLACTSGLLHNLGPSTFQLNLAAITTI